MKDFLAYLKEKKFIILAFSMIMGIFALVYFLYDVRIEAYIYAFLLAFFFFLVFILFGYLSNKNKLDQLRRLKDQTDISLLTPSAIQIEKEYQRILRTLDRTLREHDFNSQEDLKALEEFFIMWTHQIKLPISAINLYLDSGEEISKSILKGQIKRIEQYSDMVMAYIRLESEKNDFVFEEVDLDDLVKQAVKEFKLDFINKKLSLDYQPLNKSIVTDKKWFIFVLEQIISNALKYTKSGGISIFQEEGKLVIKDTGIGISEADMPRIFDKGYTGYNGRVKSDASGLGLFLVKRTLDKLHHGIKLDSKLGRGTRVSIELVNKEELFD